MKVKKFLRKVFSVMWLIALVVMTILLILGKISTDAIFSICFCWVLILLYGALYLLMKLYYKNEFEAYKEDFELFKATHVERYRAYLSADRQKVENYTNIIKRMGEMLLSKGKKFLENEYLPEEKRIEIKKIIEETKKMIETTQPT